MIITSMLVFGGLAAVVILIGAGIVRMIDDTNRRTITKDHRSRAELTTRERKYLKRDGHK